MPPVRNRGGNRNRSVELVDISSSCSNPRRSGSGGSSSAVSGATWGWEDGCATTSEEFSTSIPVERKNITWRVQDLATMVQLKGVDGKHQVKFNAGDSIDMPSKWKFEIIGDQEDKIGLFMSLVHYGGPAAKIFARFDSHIKYPDGTKDLVNRTIQPTDMKAVEDWGWSSFITIAQLKAAGLLGNDSITIQIKFILYGKKIVKTLTTIPTPILERNSMHEAMTHFGDLFETGANFDFVIKVPKSNNSAEYASVKVHRAILAARSPVFNAMLDSQMMESHTGEMQIEDMTLRSLNVVLKFVYTGVIDEDWRNIPEEIVNASDKYSLPLLKDYCDRELHSACTTTNAFDLLRIAKIHQLHNATTNIGNYIKSHMDGIVNSV